VKKISLVEARKHIVRSFTRGSWLNGTYEAKEGLVVGLNRLSPDLLES